MNVYIVDSNNQYDDMFIRNGFNLVGDIEVADLVQFTGGADITPSLYDQEAHPSTGNDPIRDKREQMLFDYCVDNDIPMAGICRGAQFLNVMCGGTLWQHVDNHTCGEHFAIDLDSGQMLKVSSTHHQMINPSDAGRVLMVASESTYKEDMQDGMHRIESARGEDVEAVYYHSHNVLCYQPHPEYYDADHQCQAWYFDNINKLLG